MLLCRVHRAFRCKQTQGGAGATAARQRRRLRGKADSMKVEGIKSGHHKTAGGARQCPDHLLPEPIAIHLVNAEPQPNSLSAWVCTRAGISELTGTAYVTPLPPGLCTQ
jgi:hypothetical protein